MSGVGEAVWHPSGCGCARCLGKTREQAEADVMGEQAETAEDLELHRLRQENAVLREECVGLARLLTTEKAARERLAREVLEARKECDHLRNAQRAEDAAQPAPIPGTGDVWAEAIEHAQGHGVPPALLAAMRARRELGIQRYGTPLQRSNGRDARRDMREELLDGYAYATQCEDWVTACALLVLLVGCW